ncbi:MAG: HD domain-containing protein [Clostridiales bacterium]|nr:HD domain-containing protein [Clostridiales bacterium]
MDQAKIAEFLKGLSFEGFLLVRTSQQRTSNNGANYLDMTLSDNSGDINAKVWDPLATPPDVGSVVKLRAAITEYNGRLQMRVDKFRPVLPNDSYSLGELVASAPEKPEDMRGEIDSAIESMQNPVLKILCQGLMANVDKEIMYYPAAQRMHHAERSGLLHHITSMLRVANAIIPCYPSLDADLVRAGVIAHDLSKITEMISDELGNVSEYTTEGLLLGHLVVGVSQVREIAKLNDIPADDEYVLLLQHMIISHHGIAEHGSPRPPMFPEAEILSIVDEMDARMNELEAVLKRTPRGVFSEKIWSLDRRVYHPRYLSEDDLEENLPFSEKSTEDSYEGLL